jgi:hypothetical protein
MIHTMFKSKKLSVNILIAQVKGLLSRSALFHRGSFCLYLFLLPSFSYGSALEPAQYFLSAYAYQFYYQNDVRLLDQLEKLTLYPKEMHDGPSLTEKSADWLIDKRNEWSSMIGNTGAQLDLFFSGEETEYKVNASYLRLGLEVKYSKKGALSFDPVFKFKLDLPTVKKRLKIVVESNLREQETLSRANLDNSLQDVDATNSTTTGAFQFFFGSAKKWKRSTSIGVRLNRNPNPFWRLRMKRNWDLAHEWQFKTLQSVYYFHDDSWGETTEFIFEKPIHSYFFTSKSKARWRHNERLMEYAQVFSITKKLSAIRAIKYELGLLSENQPNVIVTDYFFKTTYRRLLYQDWLFYEVSPELLFPAKDSFKANPSIFMRFEMKFSNL